MLQYIINTSIVWLSCLLVYDLLLRRESFHQYNRLYLLISLAAGLVLPLVSIAPLTPAEGSSFTAPVQQVYQLKNTIQPQAAQPIAEQVPTATTPVADNGSPIDIATILWLVYLTGVIIAFGYVMKEAFQLIRLYTAGSKTKQQGCVIVDTGKDHCPFSFFNIVFVRSRGEYEREQWDTLIGHEREHSRQLHTADNLLLITLRIVLWFHPLPHMYYRRLRLVHEFQADDAAATNALEYGTFLLEQNMLQGAPVLTHAINYSPLKTRIAMLTRTKSARTRLVKYTAVIPVLFFLILLCTQTSISREMSKKVNTTYFKGAEITFEGMQVIPYDYRETYEREKKMLMYHSIVALPDSVPVKDWKTGLVVMQVVPRDTVVVAINGKPVIGNEPQFLKSYQGIKYTTPVVSNSGANINEYLFYQVKDELDKLENGEYTIKLNNVVVDEQGNIAYYELLGIDMYVPYWERKPGIKPALKQAIIQKLEQALNAPVKFKPATKMGTPVNARVSTNTHQVIVKDHKAQLVERMGC